MNTDEERPVQIAMGLPANVVALLVAHDDGVDINVELAIVNCSLPLYPSDGRRTGISKIRVMRTATECVVSSCETACWLQSYNSSGGCGMLFDSHDRIRFIEPGLESLQHKRTKRQGIPHGQHRWVYLVYADDCEIPEIEEALTDCVNTANRLHLLVGQ